MLKSKNETMSRSQMLAWINRALNINQTRIENLGTGVVYCMLLNHYHPHAIQQSKIISLPRTHNDHRINLRRLQEGLVACEVKGITFDVFKVSEMTYAENWNLICKLYKHFNVIEKEKISSNAQIVNKQSRQQWWPQSKAFQIKTETVFSSTPPVFMNPLSTPMKGSKFVEDGGKFHFQSMNMIQEIKKIVTTQGVTDRVKVSHLRRFLGLQDEDGHESETDLKDLLSDYKKKQQVIQID